METIAMDNSTPENLQGDKHMQIATQTFHVRQAPQRFLSALGFSLLLAGMLPCSGLADAFQARADLRTCADEPSSIGQALFSERPSAEGVKVVDIVIHVQRELAAGQHAVHIHETGECLPCAAAGGHFDPGPNSNPSPDDKHPFHSGDLVNLDINDQGVGVLFTTTSRITLSDGPLSVFDADNSAVIIHVDPDTYCPDGPEPGCAGGDRAACGVIRPVSK
jgi:Cu-Zn family superoxide dismutase